MLASFSHISSLPSAILPVKRLAALCHEHGVLVLIDGAHAPGQMAVDVKDVGADFYVGDGHKWMFTPKGVAFLWASEAVQDLLYGPVVDGQGTFADWFSWQGLDDYSKYLAVPTALQFRQWLGGERAIHSYIHGLAVKGGAYLASRWNTSVMLPEHQYAALVTVQVPCRNTAEDAAVGLPVCPADIQTVLYQRFNTFIPVTGLASQSTPYLRISVEVYNEMSDFEMLAGAIESIIGARS